MTLILSLLMWANELLACLWLKKASGPAPLPQPCSVWRTTQRRAHMGAKQSSASGGKGRRGNQVSQSTLPSHCLGSVMLHTMGVFPTDPQTTALVSGAIPVSTMLGPGM